jgi:hypothetical protein
MNEFVSAASELTQDIGDGFDLFGTQGLQQCRLHFHVFRNSDPADEIIAAKI